MDQGGGLQLVHRDVLDHREPVRGRERVRARGRVGVFCAFKSPPAATLVLAPSPSPSPSPSPPIVRDLVVEDGVVHRQAALDEARLYCGQPHAVGGRLGDDLLREALPLLRALVAGGDLTEGAWLGLGLG